MLSTLHLGQGFPLEGLPLHTRSWTDRSVTARLPGTPGEGLTGLSEAEVQCCALLPATPAALGPWSDPKPGMEPLEPEGMGLQSHVLFLALPLPTNPSLPFHPAQGGRMWLLKYFKSRGSGEGQTGRESTSNPLPCQMWMLARSHKMPDGASLRQKALPSPHGSCLSAPQMWEDCYSCLHSPPLHCRGEPWLGIGLQNACSTNPVASVHALERDFREQGPPSPPVPLRLLFPFFIPPSSTPGAHPAFTLHRQGCCNGDGETETFYEPVLPSPPNPCPSS